MLNALGSLVYLFTVLLCLRAALSLRGQTKQRPEWHFWLGVALFFCGLIVMRELGLEDLLRTKLRSLLVFDGIYATRHEFQSVLVLSAILAFAGLIALGGRKMQRRDRRHRWSRAAHWAMFGITVMTCVVTIRLISLHATDALLYGPLHLNWILDIGAALLIAWSAIWQVSELRAASKVQARRTRRK